MSTAYVILKEKQIIDWVSFVGNELLTFHFLVLIDKTFRYKMMLACWNKNPEDRPTFEDLAKSIREIKSNETVS